MKGERRRGGGRVRKVEDLKETNRLKKRRKKMKKRRRMKRKCGQTEQEVEGDGCVNKKRKRRGVWQIFAYEGEGGVC